MLTLNWAAVGILGATVMPHSLFIGSALATQDRVAMMKPVVLPGADDQHATRSMGPLRKFLTHFRPVHSDKDEYSSHVDRPNNSHAFVKAHLRHSVVDIVFNLLGIAVIINSLYVPSYLVTFEAHSWGHRRRILMLASAVFHHPGVEASSADIYDAHALIRDIVGRGEWFR
jgi:metal iron transporter